EGESLDVSMLGAAVQLMYPQTVDAMATGKPPTRVGNVGYSGSPGADTFFCSDGRIALGANTPQQMAKLGDALGIRPQVEALMGPQARGFATAVRPAELRALLQETIAPHAAAALEDRLNATGVPAARVRDLGECVADAMAHGLIEAWTLPGQSPVSVPGLGFRSRGLYGGRSNPHGDKESRTSRFT
ncbi:MAG: CoA transferase, partial [Gammaproteobacteria bacterium]|nr:CoA transferase [Gammaproteobacteria bacterium]